jgi:glucoamylase
MIPEVAERYLGDRKTRQLFEIWKPNRQARTVKRGYTLRIQVPVPFRLHWSANEWQSVEDNPSLTPVLGFHFVDIPISAAQQSPIRFTFYWAAENRWEGRDYMVAIE